MEYGAVVSNRCQVDDRQSSLLYINQRERKNSANYTRKPTFWFLNTNQAVEAKGTNERD